MSAIMVRDMVRILFCVCTRQVQDFLQRVKCGRFPPIEKDMRMVAAHCGSLFLDPTALTQVQSCVVDRDLLRRYSFCI